MIDAPNIYSSPGLFMVSPLSLTNIPQKPASRKSVCKKKKRLLAAGRNTRDFSHHTDTFATGADSSRPVGVEKEMTRALSWSPGGQYNTVIGDAGGLRRRLVWVELRK